ncbi:hypothetical protein CPB84DRAFT_1848917 [Gymnopilus junonius]|uniref:Uncharacterized protein n=1 Tax=Gymnopilus junonius TaxID=109634 RepID=A0A9P5NJ62_GYMJU|nr:hypothetical protein CPB84DRAFT_1848917 [Gymnopilus junonius]
MKFAFSAAILSLVSLASATVLPRQPCPEASRYGNLIVSNPTNATSYNPGDPINIQVDFHCAISYFDIIPQFIDYTIQVLGNQNNGHEVPIVLARRTLAAGATTDEFSTTIPLTFYFAGAPYNVVLTDTYPIQNTDGTGQVFIEGSVEEPITINVSA